MRIYSWLKSNCFEYATRSDPSSASLKAVGHVKDAHDPSLVTPVVGDVVASFDKTVATEAPAGRSGSEIESCYEAGSVLMAKLECD